MKKILLSALLIGSSVLTGFAQTDFRHITMEEASKAATAENKLIFIDFFTTWCGPCKKMSVEIFPQKELGDYMNSTFVCMKLDAEKEGADLARKYGVKAYPTYVVIDAKGDLKGTFSGYMQADIFKSKLIAALDPTQSPEAVKTRYEKGERTPELVDAYAMQFMEARKEAEGFKVIDDYFNSLTDKQRLSKENNFLFTRYTVDMNNDRYNFMEQNADKFDASQRDAVKRQIHQLLNAELNTYFSGYKRDNGEFSQAAYDNLKSRIAKFGWADDYSNVYAAIEKRIATADDAEYLAYLDSSYSNLKPREQQFIIFNLSRLVKPTTPQLRKDMSAFIRSRLANLSPTAIMFAGRTLQSVEENQ